MVDIDASGTVIRTKTDIHEVLGFAMQTLSLDIVSLADNGVFALRAPSGKMLCEEDKSLSIVLPESGLYQVLVGADRGNTTYRLRGSLS